VNDALGWVTAGLAVAVALWCLIARDTSRPVLGALVGLEIIVVVQALAAAGLVLRGHRPASVEVFGIYLFTSVALLPVAAQMTERETGRWPNILYGVACLVLAVVVLRCQATWGS
jgi:hypothetical protein